MTAVQRAAAVRALDVLLRDFADPGDTAVTKAVADAQALADAGLLVTDEMRAIRDVLDAAKASPAPTWRPADQRALDAAVAAYLASRQP